MKKGIIWLFLSCFLIVCTLMASCAPTTPSTTTTSPPTATSKTTAPSTITSLPTSAPPTKTTAGEEPQYGGIATLSREMLMVFDPYRFETNSARIQSFIFEKLVVGDWAVDRAKFDFPSTLGSTPLVYLRGALAESWESPDPLTLILHVRKGIKWQNKPPVNGREFVADDIAWNIERDRLSPFFDRTYMDYIQSVKALDKYTVEIKFKPPPTVELVRGVLDALHLFFVPRECVGTGGTEIEDWRKMVGTGPFMIADFVPDSAVILKKNPDYWGYDELHPKNQLPYVDEVKVLLIRDPATRMSGLRTGKIDRIMEVLWQDAESLKKTNKELLSRQCPTESPPSYRMRWDKEPFTDVKVRQALSMAIDRTKIASTFFGGYALPYSGLLAPVHGELYTPYDKLPDKPMWTTKSVKEVLSYNPEGAKKLLAEAGFPNGFKTHIDTSSMVAPSLPTGLPELLQSYLAAIGVQADIKVHEWGAFNTLRYGKQHTAIISHWNTTYANPTQLFMWFADPTLTFALACVNDPVYKATYNKTMQTFDDTARAKQIKELDYYSLEHAFSIPMPFPQVTTFWQPWFKGYRGEGNLGENNKGPIFARIWIDQSQKK